MRLRRTGGAGRVLRGFSACAFGTSHRAYSLRSFSARPYTRLRKIRHWLTQKGGLAARERNAEGIREAHSSGRAHGMPKA
jgi:hypothetical protein